MVSTYTVVSLSPRKIKHVAPNPGNANYLEGLKSSELTMIRRLAGNDPLVRKKTMRKLRKWLTAIASKIPDTPESRELVDPNFVRVWKALFYCMWMADKPLPQEQLAEQISNLLTIFSSKPNISIFFMDWFFLTVGREWPWIDRFRLDKFMMLIRRFLRKSLEQLSIHKWNKGILAKFTQIISLHVFNRYPPIKKTRARARIPDPPNAPLGLQIHVTDIFLEELAKVGADTLKSEGILQLLSPFLYELTFNDDDRLLFEIKERIFVHLMKQSDAAFDYMEGGSESSDNEETDECENGIEKEDSDDEEMDYNQPLDPRAGQVNVILPQLQISYEKLALQLVESGGQKNVKNKNKKIVFALARGINELTEGRYPLAAPASGPRNPAISQKDVKIATERLITLENELKEDKLRRKTKKERKREQKQASLNLSSDNSNDSLGSEDNSTYLVDDEFNEHVGDNYLSYLEEMEKPQIKNKQIECGSSKNPNAEVVGKLQRRKNKRLLLEEKFTNGENKVNGNCEAELETQKSNNKKAKLEFSPENNCIEGATPDFENLLTSESNLKCSNTFGIDTDRVIVVKVKKLKEKKDLILHKVPRRIRKLHKMNMAKLAKTRQLVQIQSKMNEFGKTAIPKKFISDDGLISKNILSPAIRTPDMGNVSVGGTPYSSLKKRVSFVLARNSEHPHADYKDSIERSPAIPFDSQKQPNFGLLKSPAKSTIQNFISTPRKRAADFF